MQITEIAIPELLKICADTNILELITFKIKNGYCETNGDEIIIVLDYDSDIFLALRNFMKETEPTTIGGGNLKVYEYKLGIEDKDYSQIKFEILFDNGDLNNYILDSFYHENNGNNHLNLKFKLI